MKHYRLLTWANTEPKGHGYTEGEINKLAKEGYRVVSCSGSSCNDGTNPSFVFVWTLEKDDAGG